MAAVKDDLKRLINILPDDCTFEDVQHALYLCEKMLRADADGEAGRVFSPDHVKGQVQEWLKSYGLPLP